MTLEGYLEKLGGAPEPVLRPEVDLTCEEISDKGRLCHAPTVSVLMRVYRAAKFVGKALDGIFEQQTNFPFDVVVCDYCSPDDTVEVLRDYTCNDSQRKCVFSGRKSTKDTCSPMNGAMPTQEVLG